MESMLTQVEDKDETALILQEIQKLCFSLEKKGVECIFVAVTKKEETCFKMGSVAGKIFLNTNLDVHLKFQQFCDEYRSSVSIVSPSPNSSDHSDTVQAAATDISCLRGDSLSHDLSNQNTNAVEIQSQESQRRDDEDDDEDDDDNDSNGKMTNINLNKENTEEDKGDNPTLTTEERRKLTKAEKTTEKTLKQQKTGSTVQHVRRATRQRKLALSVKRTDRLSTTKSVDLLTSDDKTQQGSRLKSCQLQCDVCGQAFETSTNVMRHLKVEHTNKKHFKCQACNKVFDSKYRWSHHQFNAHSKNVIGKNTYKCKQCSKTFSNRSQYSHHMYTHGKSAQGTKKTASSDLKKTLACKFCGKTFRKQSAQKKHEALHKESNGGKDFQCTLCTKICKTEETYKYHMRLHLPDDEKPYQCTRCNKGFPSKRGLDVHQMRHSDVKNFVCELCGVTYKEKRFLNVHLRVHTGEKPYKCEKCDKTFRSNSSLRQHRSVHNQSFEICDHCGKTFRSHRHLKAHLKRLEGQTIKCDICNKVFKSLDGYKGHYIVTHLKESGIDSFPSKVYQCSFCNKFLHTNESYTRHIRTHTGERPYKCEHCGKSFSEKGNLNAHRKIHLNDKRFQCTECDKRFIHNRSLKKHMTSHSFTANSNSEEPEYVAIAMDNSVRSVPVSDQLFNLTQDEINSAGNSIHVQIQTLDGSQCNTSHLGDLVLPAYTSEPFNSVKLDYTLTLESRQTNTIG